MKNLNELPDLCLYKIFHHLPIRELVQTIPFVCSRWAALQPNVLHSRRSLSLLIGPSEPQLLVQNSVFYSSYSNELNPTGIILQSSWSQFRLPVLTETVLTVLLNSFPNLSKFECILRIGNWEPRKDVLSEQIHLLNRMLQAWSSSLISLSVFLAEIEPETPLLLISTNSELFEQLKSLTLFVDGNNYQRCRIINETGGSNWFNFGILSNLNEFNLFSHDLAFKIFPLIRANSNESMTIRLANDFTDECVETLKKDPRIIPEFCQNFIHLTWRCIGICCPTIAYRLEWLGVMFGASLTSLCLYRSAESLVEISRALSRFPNLVHLTIVIQSYMTDRGLDADDYQINKESQIPQLASVKLLTLDRDSYTFCPESHSNVHSRFWNRFLPNLVAVEIYFWLTQCQECGFDYRHDPPEISEKQKQCARLAAQPWVLRKNLQVRTFKRHHSRPLIEVELN